MKLALLFGHRVSAARGAHKRILIVQWEYAQAGGASAQAVSELAGELLRHGHDVELIAQAPVGPADRAAPRGMRLTLINTRRPALTRSHPRAWGQLNFFIRVLLRAPRYARTKDCVITLDTPSGIGLAGALMRRLSGRRIRHVCWVLDLYSHQGLALQSPNRYARLRRLRKAIDHVAYANASEVVVIGECMRDYLRREGVRNTITVIPIWQDADRVFSVDASTFRERWGLHNAPCVLYSGHATFRHPLSPLVEAARKLPELTLVIVGTGENIEVARVLVQRYGLENVRIQTPVPPHEVNALLAAGDLHAVVLDSRATGTCVPSKLYAAMAVGKPVLFLGDARCQVARDIGTSECGASVDPQHWPDVVNTLRDWLNDPDGWAIKGQSGRRFFLENREKRVVCREWLRHL